MKDICSRMFGAFVRVEAMWPLAVQEPPAALVAAFEDRNDQLPEELAELISRWDESEIENLFSGEEMYFFEAFNELVAQGFNRNVTGWIGVAATPIFKFSKDGGGASFSWGHRRTKLIFSETADGLLECAVEWASSEYKAARADARA